MKRTIYAIVLPVAILSCAQSKMQDDDKIIENENEIQQIQRENTPTENPDKPTGKEPQKTQNPTPSTPTPTDKFKEINIPSSLLYYYQTIDFNKSARELKEELAILTIEKHDKILEYNQRHPHLQKADADVKNKRQVVLLYSGEKGDISDIKGGNVINTEHIYPQSQLKSSIKGQTKGDLHHLRYCNSRVNNYRGNRPFAQAEGGYKKVGENWYPGDQWIGDVARAVMYMNLRYDEDFSKVSVGGVELMLKWNAKDPVSEFERQRNNEIEKAQGNRNPFIDNPYLATKIWGGEKAENTWK